MKTIKLKIKSQNGKGVYVSEHKDNGDYAGKFLEWNEYKKLINYKDSAEK